MSAPLNNDFWTLRSKHGRDKIFSDPQQLIEAALEYFKACDNNPQFRKEAIKGGEKAGTIVDIPTQTPYTIKGGLTRFLGINFQTWLNYREDPMFREVITEIEEICYNQKLSGAIVGNFKENVVARILGLTDKKDITTDGESMNKGYYEFLKQSLIKKTEAHADETTRG